MRISSVIKTLLAVSAVAVPLLAHAESNVVTGANTAAPGAQAHVDFQITIPKVLYLRVGTGSAYPTALTNDATVNLVQFAPAVGSVGNSVPVAATVGGDISPGVVTAAVVSNSGNVTLGATSLGALSDGAGDSIAFTEIKTASATLVTTPALPAPVLANGASATVLLTAPATKIIVQDAKWTYTYANTTNPPAGTYGGANVNNGRVTYTATMP
jgi:hypothetical protein